MSFIYGLSKAGQKVYHFLIEGIEKGLSGTEIMSILREHGLGYRLSDFYSDLRILRGEMTRWDTMKYVPKGKVISERLYTPTTTPLPTKFSTTVRVYYFIPETGEKDSQCVTVHHDTPLRREEIETLAEEIFRKNVVDYTGYEDVEILKLVPERGFMRV